MIKSLLKQKKVFIQYAVLIILVLFLASLLVSSYLQSLSDETAKNELLINEKNTVLTANAVLSNRIGGISGDLMYAADCFRLGDHGDGDYTEVEQQWLAFSNRKKTFDQIRFLDADGNELIRVNYGSSGAYLVDREKLQNKGDRYYFTETIRLKENQIYISKLDLNVENNEIEQPIKPTIRFSTPYYVKGQLKGIVILNYLADDMLSQIEQAASTGRGSVFMLNSDGYWLFDSTDSGKAWAFMYEDRADISFRNEFPSEWEFIKGHKTGCHDHISNHGLFVYTNIITSRLFSQDSDETSCVLGSGDWMLVSHLPADSEGGALFAQTIWTAVLRSLQRNVYLYAFILLISVVIAALMAMNKEEKERIRYLSEYDVMTGVYNRHFGMDSLQRLSRRPGGKPLTLSICFIDINGLKAVNDTLGHEAGDELIHSVIAGIKKNTREEDIIARLGGDEFLIVFSGLDENKAEEVWKRIIKEYDRVNETENRKYRISVSHGIISLQSSSDQSIDDVIHQADEKMYNEKRSIKKEITILREVEE